MRVKMLEKVLHDGHTFEEGEVREVSEAVGAYFCGNGWAEDAEGKVETKPRDTRPRRIEAADLRIFTR